MREQLWLTKRTLDKECKLCLLDHFGPILLIGVEPQDIPRAQAYGTTIEQVGIQSLPVGFDVILDFEPHGQSRLGQAHA